MLFGENRSSSYSLPVLKHIAEIVLSHDKQLYKDLRNTTAEGIIAVLMSKGEVATTPLQRIRSFIQYLRDDDATLSKFDRDLSIFLSRYKNQNLPYEYSKIAPMQERLRRKLETTLAHSLGGVRANFSDADWSYISHEFSRYVLEYSSASFSYDPESNGIVGFLMNTMGSFFIPSRYKMLLDLKNTRGMYTRYEGADYSRADMATVDFDKKDDLIEFSSICVKIFNASDFLYKHGGQVFYDLFSRYKFRLATKKVKQIKTILDRAFPFANVYTSPALLDSNFRVGVGRTTNNEMYARNKQTVREWIMEVLDAIVDDRVGPADLRKIVQRVYAANKRIYDRHDTSNGMVVFAVGDYQPKSSLSNDAKMTALLVGVCALRDFIKYLNKNNINPLQVASDMFRDPRMHSRFKTFREYQEFYQETKELMMGEAEFDNVDLISNDQVYNDLIKRINPSVLQLSFSSIKIAIQEHRTGSAIIKPKLVPVVDMTRVNGDIAKVLTFRQPSNNPRTLGESYSVVKTQVAEPLLKMLQQIEVLRSEDVNWVVDPDLYGAFDFEEFLQSKVSPELYQLSSLFIPESGNGVQAMLGFFRTIDFIDKFCTYVYDMLTLLSGYAQSTSELNLYLDMIDRIDGFILPKTAQRHDDFSWFESNYNIDFFLEPGQFLKDVNKHLVFLYNLMAGEFSSLMTYLHELVDQKYTPMNNTLQLVTRSAYDVPETLLEEASFDLYKNFRRDNTALPESFKRFLAYCSVDKYGFLMLDGLSYRKRLAGVMAYLHERGFWVFFSNGKAHKIMVSADDEFDGD